ncbi:3-hydroxyacyl-CoA dehydrogenase NAD-binding domain-containing protein [Pseudomonas fluorescens]|uniref:Fatty acid oxidation complex subunit alpha n=1 Tax=Pseudomonas fluorescens TaxID=294 RepID=A0A5E7CTY0_PSEFL|nr:3-hydroxyacyl-CoA dehydrogenase NAD-binding domain-containing protein [Pseudomonas fluorescens]VVN98933.1 Fatty acid oxidation complex subunit alpha [Pseudomonas fluorescens]
MNTLITLERDGNVALIYINNPPVNAGSLEVRQGLLDAIKQVEDNSDLIGAALIGAGKMFIAGSDLSEFGKPLENPQLPAVISAIEQCSKPIIAAIHGAALGGGFELALGCDARVACEGSLLGLPEVTLGMIPGAGGTQRLPRLTGIPKAIELICAGTRVSTADALALGMIDAIAEGDLASFAANYVRNMSGKCRIRDRDTPPCDAGQVERASANALKAGKYRPQVSKAINAVLNSASQPIDLALACEREVFHQLRMSNEALALRHLFFAERQSAKRVELKNVEPHPVSRVAVIGAGTMGSGISLAILQAGLDVVLLEQDEAALRRGQERITGEYMRRVKAGRISQAQADTELSHLHASTDWAHIASVQLVIEAVFEDLTVKRNLLRQVEPLMDKDAIFATNTSYLDVDQIAEVAKHPQRVIGLHFFSPANVMRLVEVVRGMYTAAEALSTGFAVVRRLGKLPILANNAFGFIGNRIYAAYRRECELMLEEGALPAQIDAAMESFGMAMGPFAVADMSGLDIAWRMRQARSHLRDGNARYVDIPDLLCEKGYFGRKTGSGYYLYDEQGRRSEDPSVADLIVQESMRKGIKRRVFSRDDIVDRTLLTMANEAALLLAEGVTTRSSDIDLVMVNGFGFPKWEGGPSFWAARQSLTSLKARQEAMAGITGPSFVKGDLAMFHHLDALQQSASTV